VVDVQQDVELRIKGWKIRPIFLKSNPHPKVGLIFENGLRKIYLPPLSPESRDEWWAAFKALPKYVRKHISKLLNGGGQV
jgi:hypothetical protein